MKTAVWVRCKSINHAKNLHFVLNGHINSHRLEKNPLRIKEIHLCEMICFKYWIYRLAVNKKNHHSNITVTRLIQKLQHGSKLINKENKSWNAKTKWRKSDLLRRLMKELIPWLYNSNNNMTSCFERYRVPLWQSMLFLNWGNKNYSLSLEI